MGRLIIEHGPSPATTHRAVAVAVISLAFFFAMLIAFYIRQQLGYFLLSSAFLIVYLLTMIGIWMQRRNTVKVYENGISYRNFSAAWGEITRVNANAKNGLTVSKIGGGTITLNSSIAGLNNLANIIRENLPS